MSASAQPCRVKTPNRCAGTRSAMPWFIALELCTATRNGNAGASAVLSHDKQGFWQQMSAPSSWAL